MKLWITAALIALVTVPTFSRAAKTLTGNELLRWCEGDVVGRGLCLGYIWGAADGLQAGVDYAEGAMLWCDPDPVVTGGQMQHIVVKYFKENPEELHMDAVGLVTVVFVKAWPCD